MPIVAYLFAETFGTSLFAADKNQASNSAIEQQLTAQYRLTTVNRGGEIVAAGRRGATTPTPAERADRSAASTASAARGTGTACTTRRAGDHQDG